MFRKLIDKFLLLARQFWVRAPRVITPNLLRQKKTHLNTKFLCLTVLYRRVIACMSMIDNNQSFPIRLHFNLTDSVRSSNVLESHPNEISH